MPRIDATVTATDPRGKVQLTIDKNPIEVPKGAGKHDIVFKLVDETTKGPTVFDEQEPIYYAHGNSCPSSGKNSDQIGVDSCAKGSLTITDENSEAGTIGYQLNFLYGDKKASLDPIIQNGGGPGIFT